MGITLCKGSRLCLGAEHQALSPLQHLGWAFFLQAARDRKSLQWEEERRCCWWNQIFLLLRRLART